jgi:hypothetical protein
MKKMTDKKEAVMKNKAPPQDRMTRVKVVNLDTGEWSSSIIIHHHH